MNEEQMQRAIEFLTQSQANSAAQDEIIKENFKELQTKLDNLTGTVDNLRETVRDVALLGRDLVRVAEIHSRRLDRLEGI